MMVHISACVRMCMLLVWEMCGLCSKDEHAILEVRSPMVVHAHRICPSVPGLLQGGQGRTNLLERAHARHGRQAARLVARSASRRMHVPETYPRCSLILRAKHVGTNDADRHADRFRPGFRSDVLANECCVAEKRVRERLVATNIEGQRATRHNVTVRVNRKPQPKRQHTG